MTNNLTKLIDSLTWRDIKDAPRDGTRILGMVNGGIEEIAWWNGVYKQHWILACDFDDLVPVIPTKYMLQNTTGQAGEVILVLVEALDDILKYSDSQHIDDIASKALAEAERIAGDTL